MIPVHPIKALFFDLDETLLDGSHFDRSILRTCGAIAKLKPELDPARLFEAKLPPISFPVASGYYSTTGIS